MPILHTSSNPQMRTPGFPQVRTPGVPQVRTLGVLPGGVLVVLIHMLVCLGAVDACIERSYSSRAVEQESDSLLYFEHHRETLCDGARRHWQVTYVGVDGDTLATKSLDFSRHAIKPDVILNDRRTGYREGAVVRGDSIEMFRRLDRTAPEHRDSFHPERLAAINAGFDQAIRSYWDLLASGSRVEFDFAVPDRLRSFHFRIRRLGKPGDTLRLRIEPANWWLRWVVSRIDITYDSKTRRVLVYEGITDMRDERGRRYRARIDFDYTDPSRTM
jgi:hypothetical protein